MCKYTPFVHCLFLADPSCSQTSVMTHPFSDASLVDSATVHLHYPCHTQEFLDPCQMLFAAHITLNSNGSGEKFEADVATKNP